MFRSAFALNLRSLGVARITFAVLILFDLMQRSVDLVAHYTDFGLLPRVAIIEHPYSRWHWSVHLMSGTWQMQALLFVIAAFCAVFLGWLSHQARDHRVLGLDGFFEQPESHYRRRRYSFSSITFLGDLFALGEAAFN